MLYRVPLRWLLTQHSPDLPVPIVLLPERLRVLRLRRGITATLSHWFKRLQDYAARTDFLRAVLTSWIFFISVLTEITDAITMQL